LVKKGRKEVNRKDGKKIRNFFLQKLHVGRTSNKIIVLNMGGGLKIITL
jgi:hypothetical protein